jgi:LAO/AO transport system kinase
VIVVNKSDHPLTDTMVREIRGVLSLGPQGAGACRSSRPRPPRRGRRGARREAREHRAFVEAEGPLSERRRRNLMNEVLGPRHRAPAPRARGVAARGPEVQQLLDEVVARGSTRRAPPARSSPAGRSRPATPRGRIQQAKAAR